jgi:hypothetical protein
MIYVLMTTIGMTDLGLAMSALMPVTNVLYM